MANKSILRIALLGLGAFASSAFAQSASDREPGWEAGFDVIYQDSTTLGFDGGTEVDLDSDVGLGLTFGYRLNSRVETTFAFDWSKVSYDAALVTSPPSLVNVSGSYESFTPRMNMQFNLLDRPFTPFVMGGIGYSWVDTNIPNGRPQTGCWWDPWYGYLCATVQPTKSIDGFAYQVGLGARLDVSDEFSVRFAAERHWVDFGNGGTQHVDQFKLGISRRF